MTLVLCARADLPAVIEAHDPEVIISAVGRGEELPSSSDRRSVVHLAFNDVQRDSGPWRAPTARHVERLFAAVDGWSGDRPLVTHCHEGRSRAPAVLLGTMCRLDVEPAVAVDRLVQAAPWCAPHPGFLLLLDTALHKGGCLVQAMRKQQSLAHTSKQIDRRAVVMFDAGCRIQGI